MDKSTLYIKERWAAELGFLVLFVLRIVFGQGWYLFASISVVNLYLAFLKCKFDDSLQQDENNNELEAGEKSNEFCPLIKRLPDFRFLYNYIREPMLSMLLSLFIIADIKLF